MSQPVIDPTTGDCTECQRPHGMHLITCSHFMECPICGANRVHADNCPFNKKGKP